MPTYRKYDSVPAFTFHVTVEGVEVGFFTACTGLSFERDVVEFKEGGTNDFVYLFPGKAKQGTVQLKRGVDPDLALYDWYSEGAINGKMGRRNVSILVFNRAHEQIGQFDLLDAFPTEYSGPAVKADEISRAVEIVSITHGGQPSKGGGGGGGDGIQEDEEKATDQKIDLSALAVEVYALMKREARLDSERLGRR
jgi:phage tail-like protein